MNNERPTDQKWRPEDSRGNGGGNGCNCLGKIECGSVSRRHHSIDKARRSNVDATISFGSRSVFWVNEEAIEIVSTTLSV
jgi:hypothetical protein